MKQTYPIQKSPFWKLSNKRLLSKLLRVDLDELKRLTGDENYRIFPLNTKGKKRKICDPKPDLKKTLKRLNKLLSRIETPEYLTSKAGYSYVDNARRHAGIKDSLSMDIKNYYPSISRELVFRCFKYIFQMSDDVAWLLADFVTYEGRLPQGSPTSHILAFWCNSQLFDLIDEYCKEQDFVYTQYVDDMNFSSFVGIPFWFDEFIKRILSKNKLRVNEKKTIWRKSTQSKWITGVFVPIGGGFCGGPPLKLRVKKKWIKISRLRQSFKDKGRDRFLSSDYRHEVKSLLGMIQAVRQVEKNAYENFYKNLRKENLLVGRVERQEIFQHLMDGWSAQRIAKKVGVKQKYVQYLCKRAKRTSAR